MNRYSSILHCNIINSIIYVNYKFYNKIMHIYLGFVDLKLSLERNRTSYVEFKLNSTPSVQGVEE